MVMSVVVCGNVGYCIVICGEVCVSVCCSVW